MRSAFSAEYIDRYALLSRESIYKVSHLRRSNKAVSDESHDGEGWANEASSSILIGAR